MAVMPKEVQDAFNQMKNIVLATATPDGVPNADPMGMKKVIDAETVYISDQFFNKTLANLKENQKVAITFWGDEGAYQIHGTATYINEGEQFEELKAWVDSCFAAMGAIKREMNNPKWTLGAIGYMCGFAYVIAMIVYQVGGLITGET